MPDARQPAPISFVFSTRDDAGDYHLTARRGSDTVVVSGTDPKAMKVQATELLDKLL